MNDYNQNEENKTMNEEDLNLEEHQTRVPFSQIIKAFFTGRLFKCILLAFGVHVVFILVTSIGMFFAEETKEKQEKNGNNEKVADKDGKKSDGPDSEKNGGKEDQPESEKDEADEENEVADGQGKDSATDEDKDGEKDDAENDADKTKPTGNPEDYNKNLETITPDKAPDNPLEMTDDEDELP